MSNVTTTSTDTRSELYARLSELAELIPAMRAGQLIAAVGELCADLHGRGLWDATDAELLEAVWQFRNSLPSPRHRIGEIDAEAVDVGRQIAVGGDGDGEGVEGALHADAGAYILVVAEIE